MRNIVKYLSIVVLVVAMDFSTLWAQGTAEIAGTVVDSTGAVLPGVEVTVTQTDTGLVRTAVSNERGAYVLPNLPIGGYRLEASLPGFTTFVQTAIVLTVNASPVINPVMQVGQVAETIEVQANAVQVETRNQGVGQLVGNERILELPLNGRNVEDLITLAAGAQPGDAGFGDSGGNFFNDTGGFSVAGGLAQGIDFALDGAEHTNVTNNLQLPMPFPDALQEFNVETSALTAKHGTHSAGSVAAVTKSGTNQFHGNLFEFVRNYKFNARNFFATERDSLKRNQFGGTVGGPIIKDKLLFFAGLQDTYIRSNSVERSAFVPTAQMLAGDFTTAVSPACTGRPITLKTTIPGNPAGRPADFVHFVNNQIDPALFSPAAVAFASFLPKPINECGKTLWGAPRVEDGWQTVGRMDYHHTSNHSIFGRYMATHLVRPDPFSASGGNMLNLSAGGADALVQSFTFADQYLFGGNIVQSFHVVLSRMSQNRTAALTPFSLSEIGVKVYDGYAPNLARASVSGAFTAGGPNGTKGRNGSATFGLAYDLSWLSGNHQWEFGFKGSQAYTNYVSNAWANAQGYFSSQWSGFGLADFLLGYTQRFGQGVPIQLAHRRRSIGLYLQDTWKMNPRVTLNYGVRWEPSLPPVFETGALNFSYDRFQQGIKSTVFPNAPAGIYYGGDPGSPGPAGVNTRYNQFSPRLGVAWDVSGDGRTSVRAAYGLFYDFYSGQFYTNMIQSPPFFPNINASGAYFDDPWANFPGGNPHPFQLTGDVKFTPFSGYEVLEYDHPSPSVSQWNLTVQRQVGSDWLMSAGYVGSTSIHLPSGKALNPAVYMPGATTRNTNTRRRLYLENPVEGQLIGVLNLVDAGGTASYNGMVLTVERRSSSGVNINANYTWSHCISDPYDDLPSNRGGGYTNPDDRRFDRGNCAESAIDRRHLFNFTVVAQSPQFASRSLQALAGNWRLSPILRIRSGSFFDVETGTDTAFNGGGGQRAEQISSEVFGAKTVGNYLDPSAFQSPAPGTLTRFQGARAIQGPGYWGLDVALSRAFQIRESQRLEFRAEAFNITNSLRMMNPVSDLSASDFGRITEAADPRILQFAFKYRF